MVDLWERNSFHVNKKSILVASTDVVVDCNEGAIPMLIWLKYGCMMSKLKLGITELMKLKCYILKSNKKNLINYSLT